MTPLLKLQHSFLVNGFFCLCVLFMLPVFSQAQSLPFEGDLGKGDFWKRTFTDESGNKVSVTIYYKGKTNEPERIDSIVEYPCGGKLETKIHFVAGDTSLVFQYYYAPNKKLKYERTKDFDNDGNLESDNTTWLKPDGKPVAKREYDPKTKTYQTKTLKGDKWVVADNPIDQKENPGFTPLVDGGAICTNKLQLYAGYSFLRASNGSSGLTMPLGFNIGFTYDFMPKLRLVVDGTYNLGNKMDQKFNRQFLLTGIQYKLREEDEGAVFFTNIALGYVRDGIKYKGGKNSGGGFAAAAGVGADIKVKDKVQLKIKAEALPVLFNSEVQIDYRIGISAGLGSLCKSSKLMKYPNLVSIPRSPCD